MDQLEQDFSDSALLAPGTIIGRAYTIIRLIGRGGMGDVYLARHEALGKKCALKIIPPQRVTELSWGRFKHEAKIVAQLDHLNLVRVTDLGIDDGCLPFYAMDYVQGQNLVDLLHQTGPMTLASVLDIFMQVCDGVDYAHRNGILHRDLKPANIMVSRTSTKTVVAKVLDFGLAKLTRQDREEQSLTVNGDIFGSPPYMSPEHCRGAALDRRSDIYSVGCTMFECLTGQPPFGGSLLQTIIFCQMEVEAPSLASVVGDDVFPQSIELVIARLLQKDPDKRYQNLAELKADLQFIHQSEQQAADQTSLKQSENNAKANGSDLTIKLKAEKIPVNLPFAVCCLSLLAVTVAAGCLFYAGKTRSSVSVNRVNAPLLSAKISGAPRAKNHTGQNVLTPTQSLASSSFKSADDYLARAVFCQEHGDFDSAKILLDKALLIAPNHKFVWLRLAAVLAAKKDFDRALIAANRAIAIDPQLQYFYTERADIFIQKKDYGAALADAQKAIGMDAKDPLNYFRRAMAFEGQQKNAQALQDFTTAIALDPRSYFLSEKIDLLTRLHRHKEAFDTCSLAIAKDPRHGNFYFMAALSLMAQGADVKQTIPWLNQALLLDPANIPALTARADLYNREGAFTSALLDADRAVRFKADDPLVYYRRGQALTGLNRKEEALKSFDKAISLDGRQYFYIDRALLQRKMHHYQKAIDDVDAAIHMQPSPTLLRLRGELHRLNGDFEQAAEDIKQSKIVRGEGFDHVAVEDEKQLREAVMGYSAVLQVNPFDTTSLYNRAVANICLGQQAQALLDLIPLVDHCSYPATRVLAACSANLAYRQLNRTEEARAVLDKIEAKEGQWPDEIVQYLQGKASAENVLHAAHNKDELLRSKYYIGMDLLLHNRSQQGRALLSEVIAGADARLVERSLAQTQMQAQK